MTEYSVAMDRHQSNKIRREKMKRRWIRIAQEEYKKLVGLGKRDDNSFPWPNWLDINNIVIYLFNS